MGRPVLKVEGYTADDIKSLFRADERYTIGLRLYAVHQVALGQPSRKLEELYNVSFKQITNWVHRFEKDGLDGLRDKPRSGRKPRLSAEQLDRIKNLLTNESPTDHDYNTGTWTGPILINWIKKTYDIDFKKAQIYNVLKSLGLTHQKCRGNLPEADLVKQEEFKEDLKKNS